MPFRDDLLNPIPGDNPSGPDLRYDPQLDKIKEARREELDLDQGEWKTAVKTADHKLVIRLASELLAKRSKDLQVTVWLIEAHVRQEGFAQVAPAFRLVKDLLEQFWDTIHPEIEEGDLELRATPLEWLGSKIGFYLKELPLTRDKLSWHKYQESRVVGVEPPDPNASDYDTKVQKRNALIAEGKISPEQFDESVAATPLDFLDGIALELDEALVALEELSQLCDEKFGYDAPSFRVTRETIEEIAGTLRQLIKTKERAAPPPAPEPDEDEESASDDESGSSSSRQSLGLEDDLQLQLSSDDQPAGSEPLLELEELEPLEELQDEAPRPVKRKKAAAVGIVPTSLEDAAERLAAICRYFRAENEVDVAPYLIIRGFRWGEIRYAAPPIRPALLEPPPTELRVKLKKMHQENDWNAIIPECEEAMALPCGRGWLDLQRYALAALEGRGFNEIVMAIKGTLRNLLTDLPELLDMTFSDDTPTANAETKTWIESSIMRTPEPAAAAPAAGSDDTPSDDFSSSSESSDDFSSMSLDEPTPDSDFGSSSDLDLSSSDTPSEPEPAPEPLPDPPPPLDLAEMPPLLDDMPMETPETLEFLDDGGPKDIFDQAIAAVKAGNTKEGVALITKTLATERSGRARFKRRTQIAHLLIAAGQEKIAKPILNQLTGEVEERKLEEWEDGEAIAYSIELLLRCLVLDPAESERRTELYAKMCRLDPARALNHSYANA